MSASRVVVVVPTLVAGAQLARCLAAVAGQTLAARVVVVANGAEVPDPAPEPNVTVLRLGTNRGFTGGVNAGIADARRTGAEFVALLNDDAVPQPGWLETMVAALDRDPGCGAVTPKLRISGTNRLDGVGDGYSRWGLPFAVGRGEADDGQYDEPREVFAVSGCAPVYRMRMLDEVGDFDDRFFAYYEDVDLGFRARLAGWSARCDPRAVVDHDVGATSDRIPAFTTFHAAKNMVYLYVKNMPSPLLLRCLPRFVAACAAYAVLAVRRGAASAVARAWFTVLRELPGALAERRRVQLMRRVDVQEIERWLVRGIPPRRIVR